MRLGSIRRRRSARPRAHKERTTRMAHSHVSLNETAKSGRPLPRCSNEKLPFFSLKNKAKPSAHLTLFLVLPVALVAEAAMRQTDKIICN